MRLITAYKYAKAVLQISLAVTLAILIARGGTERLHDFAAALREHGVSVWSVWAARLLLAVATERRLELTALALAFDGILSSVEGVSLARGYRWGPWLVVIATASLVPWELVEVSRHVRLGRLLVLLVNVCIVVYLARSIRLEHSRRPNAGADRS